MTLPAGYVSTGKDDYPTPQDLWDTLNDEFDFCLDAAASAENTKCFDYFSMHDDALSKAWMCEYGGPGECAVWCNPPYGRGVMEAWVSYGLMMSDLYNVTVVMLVPVAIDTNWWLTYAMKADEVRFIKGRPRFGNADANAMFPSAILVFRPHDHEVPRFLWISKQGVRLA